MTDTLSGLYGLYSLINLQNEYYHFHFADKHAGTWRYEVMLLNSYSMQAEWPESGSRFTQIHFFAN